jgi:hypothetical protein
MNNVLYFPYISVPNSAWFTRILLYWDSVSSIAPLDFWEEPGKLTAHMRSLVRVGLVRQVHPGGYIYDIPGFDDEFLSFLEGLDSELDVRRSRFNDGTRFRIHAEKMGSIPDALVAMSLAEEDGYPWFQVERQTGPTSWAI